MSLKWRRRSSSRRDGRSTDNNRDKTSLASKAGEWDDAVPVFPPPPPQKSSSPPRRASATDEEIARAREKALGVHGECVVVAEQDSNESTVTKADPVRHKWKTLTAVVSAAEALDSRFQDPDTGHVKRFTVCPIVEPRARTPLHRIAISDEHAPSLRWVDKQDDEPHGTCPFPAWANRLVNNTDSVPASMVRFPDLPDSRRHSVDLRAPPPGSWNTDGGPAPVLLFSNSPNPSKSGHNSKEIAAVDVAANTPVVEHPSPPSRHTAAATATVQPIESATTLHTISAAERGDGNSVQSNPDSTLSPSVVADSATPPTSPNNILSDVVPGTTISPEHEPPSSRAHSDRSRRSLRTRRASFADEADIAFSPRVLELSKRVAKSLRGVVGKGTPVRFSDVFKEFDTRGVNQVTFDEFAAGLDRISSDLTSEEALELFRNLDGEGKGYITRRAFGSCIRPHVQHKSRRQSNTLSDVYSGQGATATRQPQRRQSSDFSFDKLNDIEPFVRPTTAGSVGEVSTLFQRPTIGGPNAAVLSARSHTSAASDGHTLPQVVPTVP